MSHKVSISTENLYFAEKKKKSKQKIETYFYKCFLTCRSNFVAEVDHAWHFKSIFRHIIAFFLLFYFFFFFALSGWQSKDMAEKYTRGGHFGMKFALDSDIKQ